MNRLIGLILGMLARQGGGGQSRADRLRQRGRQRQVGLLLRLIRQFMGR